MLFSLCILSRFGLAMLAKYINKKYLPYMGIVILIMAIGFLYIYFFGSKIADSQLEWTGEKTVWWSHFRIVHGLLYLAFSIMAFKKSEHAWRAILIDTGIGLSLFIQHHYLKLF
jgi:hypothetical protein